MLYFKVFISAAILYLYGWYSYITSMASQAVAADIAIEQLKNPGDATWNLQMLNHYASQSYVGWLFVFVVIGLIFTKEIKQCVKSVWQFWR